jgi:hypothetical protein
VYRTVRNGPRGALARLMGRGGGGWRGGGGEDEMMISFGGHCPRGRCGSVVSGVPGTMVPGWWEVKNPLPEIKREGSRTPRGYLRQ